MEREKEFYPDYHNFLGVKNYKTGNMMEAINCFKKAISLNKTYVEAFVNLGVTYSDCGLKEDAVKAFERAYVLDQNYLNKYDLKVEKRERPHALHKKLAKEYLSKNMFEDALYEIDEAIEHGASFADLYNFKGVILIKLKRYDEAMENIKLSLKINSEYQAAKSNLALIHYYKGLHYFENGMDQKAIAEWKRSLIIDPVKSMVKVHLSKDEDKITMKITCPNCKGMLNTYWKYCPFCGEKRTN
jgi:tetratricopeptide (TPR) repeat protein